MPLRVKAIVGHWSLPINRQPIAEKPSSRSIIRQRSQPNNRIRTFVQYCGAHLLSPYQSSPNPDKPHLPEYSCLWVHPPKFALMHLMQFLTSGNSDNCCAYLLIAPCQKKHSRLVHNSVSSSKESNSDTASVVYKDLLYRFTQSSNFRLQYAPVWAI